MPVLGVTVTLAVPAAPAGADAMAEKATIPVADKASALTNPTQPRKRIPGRMLPPRSIVQSLLSNVGPPLDVSQMNVHRLRRRTPQSTSKNNRRTI